MAMVDFSYAEGLEAHMDEGGKINPGNTRDMIQLAKEQNAEIARLRDENKMMHLRGLELAKALTVCIEAMAPSDRGGISMQEWNRRLKNASKQACATLSEKRDADG